MQRSGSSRFHKSARRRAVALVDKRLKQLSECDNSGACHTISTNENLDGDPNIVVACTTTHNVLSDASSMTVGDTNVGDANADINNVDMSAYSKMQNSNFAEHAVSPEKLSCDCTNTFDSSSDDDDDDVEEPVQCDIADGLRNWALRFGITLIALSALLSLLRLYHPSLPKDPRTLMKTARNTVIEQKAGGWLYHFGIIKSLETVLDKLYHVIPDKQTLFLQLNIDGLPLFKSSNMQFWPVLGLLKQFSMKAPVVITLFCGNSKPSSLDEFLGPVVREISDLRNGFAYRKKQFFLEIKAVICDAPARAYVKAIKSHTGYSGCDKCSQTGEYTANRMTFPEVNAPLRSDESFQQQTDEDHHTGHSPFADVLGMVSCFPHDYMHLVCLGVMRRLLQFWTSGPVRCRLPSCLVERISLRLIKFRQFIPAEFARYPRGLKELDRWKATELRQFLLYTGPVSLYEVLKPEMYDNFMLVSVAIYILSSPKYCLPYCDFAKQLLTSFVGHFGQLYGVEMTVYNIHCLVHLADDCKIHGCLDSFSGFPYENYLGKLKKLIRKAYLPLAQVVRRLSEAQYSNSVNLSYHSVITKQMHSSGPVPPEFSSRTTQYKEVILEKFTLKTSSGNNCIGLGSSVALIHNFLQFDSQLYVVYEEFLHMQCFFEYPVRSSDLGIYVLSCLSGDLKCIRLDDISTKYVLLPVDEKKFVGIPLLHACY